MPCRPAVACDRSACHDCRGCALTDWTGYRGRRYAEELQPYIKVVKLSGMLMVAAFMGHLVAALWFYVGQGSYIKPDGQVSYGWVHEVWGLPTETNETTGEMLGPMSPLPWAVAREVGPLPAVSGCLSVRLPDWLSDWGLS
eukprot:SAG22_NODE_4179_length_1356_cov_1.447892_2_plen_141_part_00